MTDTNDSGPHVRGGMIYQGASQRSSVRELMQKLNGAMLSGTGSRGPNPDDASIVTSGAQFVEVEVDTLTGRVRVLRVVAAHDCGRIINPLTFRSQIMGEHHAHALFQQSPCIAPHPSDPATALLTLGATVVLAGPDGQRSVELLELLAPPADQRRTLNTLGQSELITGITLPARGGWRSSYQKAMERAAYAFALAGVAAAIRVEQGQVAAARIGLGGVANTPLLAEEAAASLIGKPLTDESIAIAAELAARGAQPLPQTVYKKELVMGLVRAALTELR